MISMNNQHIYRFTNLEKDHFFFKEFDLRCFSWPIGLLIFLDTCYLELKH